MSKINRGKQFEQQIRKALETCPACAFLRLTDSTMGFAGVANPCDFLAYVYPYMYFFECKSCYGNTLPFANITKHQYESLLEYADIYGVVAGYLIWFIDHDVTVFVGAQDLAKYRASGKKSINIKDILSNELRHLVIYGEKKRILFDYKIVRFFEYINNYGKDFVK